MQTERPDDATGDSVLLARVHAFLATLLSFLGFGTLPTATIADMLDELTEWLELAKAIRRDPQGATARIWWDAFKTMWADPEMGASDCAKNADAAVAEFGKRFLPVNDEDRDTLNTADFDALREELDKQTQIAAELRSERDTLLAASTNHAREVQYERDHFASLWSNCVKMRSDILAAIDEKEDEGLDVVACVKSYVDKRNGLLERSNAAHLENAEMANALDAIRSALLAPSLPDDETGRVAVAVINERNELYQRLGTEAK